MITVEEATTTALSLDFTEGMQFDKGYISPYFVTDPERMEAVLDDPLILLVQGKVAAQRVAAALEKVMQAGKPLVVIAEDVEGEALSALVVNKVRGTFNSAAVKARPSASGARPCCRTSRSSPVASSCRPNWA